MKSVIFSVFKRNFTIKTSVKPKICVIGAGPAGFYATQLLVKKINNVEVDIYERLPVPFGLIRYGVAPDHPDVKNVTSTFTKTAEHPNVRYIGNVTLGKSVGLNELKEAYNVVLLSYGAEENRSLNIPGEDLKSVLPARNIIGWYNGVPWDSNLKIDLSGETVVIFGQGNVAIDVARILLSPIDKLKTTDITQHSLEVLSQSKVKEVRLIGRRGPLQAAFTIKELREVIKLDKCCTIWSTNDFCGLNECIPKLNRAKKRIMELMMNSCKETKMTKADNKVFCPIFHRSPLEISKNSDKIKVILGINALEGDDLINKRAVLTDKREEMFCNLAVSSVGYKSVQVDGNIPFDQERGLVKNVNGKAEDGLYACGWLATGPTGVILTTMSNAFATAEEIVKSLQENVDHKPGFQEIAKILKRGNTQTVMWKDWLKIDEFEVQEGKKLGKPREKIIEIAEMLRIAA